MDSPLTLTHLRFDVIARTPIKLGSYQAGERLRDALAEVMLRAACPQTPRARQPSPEHAAECPVCWLLASSPTGDSPAAGEVRRVYALAMPDSSVDVVAPGQRFSFVLTLFGTPGLRYLPYFVLAVPEAGRTGLGPGRGKFDLEAIWAINPLCGQAEAILQPGENVVRLPDVQPVSWTGAQAVGTDPVENGQTVRVEFLTPTRLIESDALVRTPDFGVLFQRLLKRVDELGEQFASQPRRSREEVDHLHTLANGVRLVDADVQWVDIWGPSSRTGRRTPMGGFTGYAVYRARDWRPLLTWLVLGQAAQVGKLTVKGNGVFQLSLPGKPGYWQQIMQSG